MNREEGKSKNRPAPNGACRFLVEEDGFEPSKSKTTDLQSAPFGHLGTPPYGIVETWSWWTDSNPRPADYKSAALPAELHQRVWHITFAAKVIIAGVPPIVNMFSQKNQVFFSSPGTPGPGAVIALFLAGSNELLGVGQGENHVTQGVPLVQLVIAPGIVDVGQHLIVEGDGAHLVVAGGEQLDEVIPVVLSLVSR